MNYLNEAFKKLEMLNEEDFSLTNDGISDLKKFKDGDTLDVVTVIDPKANSEEDLQDSYVGKVILDCEVCHSKMYKDPSEVNVDSELNIANKDEECPFCYSNEGFKVIGQVADFNPDVKVETEDPETEVKVDGKDVDKKDDNEETNESLEEGYGDDAGYYGGQRGRGIWKDTVPDWARKQGITASEWERRKSSNADYNRDLTRYGTGSRRWNESKMSKKDDLIDGQERLEEDAFNGGYAGSGSIDTGKRAGGAKKVWNDAFEGKKTKTVKAKDLKPGMVTSTGEVKKVTDIGWQNGKPTVEISYGGTGAQGSHASDVVPEDRNYEILDESFENVSIDTGSEVINVTTEPKDPNSSAESIVPVEDDVAAQIKAPEEDGEVSKEGAPAEGEDVPMADTETVDLDADELVEESWNYLGESYLKNVYGNVDSYKATAIKSVDNKMIVEGVIKFTSGKEKQTSFIFESHSATKSGKVKFIGENAQITRGKKAFSLTGSISDKKLIVESLNYNYRAKDTDGKSRRIYGRVKNSK